VRAIVTSAGDDRFREAERGRWLTVFDPKQTSAVLISLPQSGR